MKRRKNNGLRIDIEHLRQLSEGEALGVLGEGGTNHSKNVACQRPQLPAASMVACEPPETKTKKEKVADAKPKTADVQPEERRRRLHGLDKFVV